MTWPNGPSGQAAAVFEASGGGANQPFQGPWAWFRLLEKATVTPQSDVRYKLQFRIGGRSATVIMDAASIRNPFARPELLRFRCG
jgi:type VI secretion system protein ImpL